VQVDTRIIAASNRDLLAEAKKEPFGRIFTTGWATW
jgi:DNA-binding NtrC family response regulator